jgi:hypothetical protein
MVRVHSKQDSPANFHERDGGALFIQPACGALVAGGADRGGVEAGELRQPFRFLRGIERTVGHDVPCCRLIQGSSCRGSQSAEIAGPPGEAGVGAYLLGQRAAQRSHRGERWAEARRVAPGQREQGGRQKQDRGREEAPQQER